MFETPLCGCVVLDEASQMGLPEAVMGTLALREDGQLIIVGDHRQMPPIIKHNWDFEPRRTCTVPVWDGEREGISIEVWGNEPTALLK